MPCARADAFADRAATRPRACTQLDSEKRLRRQWKEHDKQQQIFEPSGAPMAQLNKLDQVLSDMVAEPTRTGKPEEKKPPSHRSQMKKLRDEMRATLANVDAKLAEPDEARQDPQELKAREQAMEAMKLPPHLRGSRVLKETMGGGDS